MGELRMRDRRTRDAWPPRLDKGPQAGAGRPSPSECGCLLLLQSPGPDKSKRIMRFALLLAPHSKSPSLLWISEIHETPKESPHPSLSPGR